MQISLAIGRREVSMQDGHAWKEACRKVCCCWICTGAVCYSSTGSHNSTLLKLHLPPVQQGGAKAAVLVLVMQSQPAMRALNFGQVFGQVLA